jgi:hypothetical protein
MVYETYIIIRGIRFDFVSDFNIDSSYENLTDSGSVLMPKALRFEGRPVQEIFRRGDPIEIYQGYSYPDGDGFITEIPRVFKGHITTIKPSEPMELGVEDEMFLFKQFSFNWSTPKAKLSEVINKVIAQSGRSIPLDLHFDMEVGKYRATNATGAMIFEHLRSNYGVQIFFRDGILNVGFAYKPENAREVNFDFGRNIIDEDGLEYQLAENIRIKIKAVSITKDNKKIEVEAGDPDGEIRTLHTYNMPEKDLRAWAEREILKYKYEGYAGGFSSFALPFTRHGDLAVIGNVRKDNEKPAGTYLVKSVRYTPTRQEITLDRKIL